MKNRPSPSKISLKPNVLIKSRKLLLACKAGTRPEYLPRQSTHVFTATAATHIHSPKEQSGTHFIKDALYPSGRPSGQREKRGQSLTLLVVLLGPGARPVLRVAVGPRRLLLLGAGALAEVDALRQARQIL